MSGGGNTTTVQKADPWGPVQAPLQGAINEAEALYARGGFAPPVYNRARVAGFGSGTTRAHSAINEAAMGPQASDAGRAALYDLMQGDAGIYRDMDAVRSDVLGSVVPAVTAQFANNGMTDSGMAQTEVSRAATQALAPIEYGAYNNAQDRRLRASALAPSLDQAAYMPGMMMGQVGAQQDARNQAVIDANIARFREAGMADDDALRAYSQLLLGYGGSGGMSTGTQPGASMGSQIAGAGMMGLGAYGALAGAGLGGPVGAGIAGGLGLLSLL